jgi:hypothetical protein
MPNVKNNLDFDFTEYEQVIKSLEQEIEKERRMRTEVNMKYVHKMKELEQAKVKALIGNDKPVNKRTSKVINTYSANRSKSTIKNSRFKNALNKTIDIIQSGMPKERRPRSCEVIDKQVKSSALAIKQVVDKSFNNLYKEIIRKNQHLITKSGRSDAKSRRTPKEHEKNKQISPRDNENITSYPMQSNTNLSINPMSINTNILSSPAANSRFILLNSSNVENKMLQDVINQKNLDKFNSLDKLQMISSLNQEINHYNKGLPQLINKVESAIEKINTTNYLSKNIHPIIEMASKHTGSTVHLHIEELVEYIINDLLIENVLELQFIEEQHDKQNNKQQFAGFLSDYYKNFELIKNIEIEVSKKLTTKNYNIKTNIIQTKPDRKEIIIYRNPFEVGEPGISAYNPNIVANREIFEKYKGTYKAKSHYDLILKCEGYKKNYLEFMKTTGAFYFPNIFHLYDEVVDDLLRELMDEQLSYCARQIDNLATDLFKDEIIN